MDVWSAKDTFISTSTDGTAIRDKKLEDVFVSTRQSIIISFNREHQWNAE
jgi:hypothetical protein